MNRYKEFGKYLLKHLGVEQHEDLDWEFIIRRFAKRGKEGRKPGLMWINWTVATYFGANPSEVKSLKSKKREHVYPRHISMYLSNVLFGYTQDEITEFYSGAVKNRSSVANAITNVDSLRKSDKYFNLDVDEITNKVLNNDEDERSNSIGSIISIPESEVEEGNDMPIDGNREVESSD